ncbi:MAG: mandelate racemase/muconate lactonizing enzyme family protein [Anaerolineae bacterium]|nr:mandelate racemase/muconate lactonizing enzyme family protein [Anaerolineae bacterium]
MRITKLETLCLSRMHEPERQWITARYRTVKADCAIVVVHTDAGLQGIGEASAYGGPLLIRAWVDWLAPELVGRDPQDESIVPHPNGLSRSHDAAIAGIDCALWDLRGKIAGLRTSELLRADALDRVRIYASSGCRYDWRHRPEQLIDEALEYVDMGLTAMKFRLGTDWTWDGVTVDRFLGLVRELTQAMAGRMELMLDGNQRLDESQAMAIAQELDRLGFAWFEEPIPRDQIDGYVRLCAAVEMPITGGEGFTTLEQFRPYLEQRAYDIVQPDAGICGITECMRIAQMAQRYDVNLCPHSWHNGLMAMANGHLVAALPHPRVLELCMIQGPLQWDILAAKPAIENGWLALTDKPGLGVALAERLEERFPYIEGSYALQVQR